VVPVLDHPHPSGKAMANSQTRVLSGGDFHESFLMDVQQHDWPNDYIFVVWSPNDDACYRITTSCVLEFHYMRIGTGRLEGSGEGIPIGNIYESCEDEYEYWSERIMAFSKQGLDAGSSPICLEFDSHLFANRKRQLLTRDRNTGILVACRSVVVERDPTYNGSRPSVHVIPSDG